MIKGYVGLGVVALFCLMWWGISHYKGKAEKLKAELADQVTLTKTQSAQIATLAEANKQSKATIDELEFINLQWSKRLEQTKQQFEQAKTEQAKELQSIRSKYDEARKKTTNNNIVSDDFNRLRAEVCRYCGKTPFSREKGADNVPD